MCTSFSSFHVLNRVNIVHLIYTSILSSKVPSLNPQSSILNPQFSVSPKGFRKKRSPKGRNIDNIIYTHNSCKNKVLDVK